MGKFYIETYGCQMNVYDSHILRSILKEMGWEEVNNEREADLIILNTCSVREHAEKRVMGRIWMVGRFRNKKLGIVGCMAQRLKERLLEIPHVLFVAGPDEYRKIPELIEKGGLADSLGYELYREIFPEQRGVSAFIAISRGCNNFCSYCIVPYVRGRERSRPPEDIIEEVKRLVDMGVKEITLLGQNVNSYRYGSVNFPGILAGVAEVPGVERVSFLTSHPKDFSRELVDVMASVDKVVKYLHLPLQSASNRVLRDMKRKYTFEEYMEKIELVREKIPELTLTTDLLVGFPTETEEDFQKTIDAVKKIEFDQSYMFRFSPREGTLGSMYPDPISEEEKLRRLSELIRVQNEITGRKPLKEVGKKRRVLICDRAKKGGMLGRDETGKLVVVDRGKPGEVVDVVIEKVSGWTPLGRVIEKQKHTAGRISQG